GLVTALTFDACTPPTASPSRVGSRATEARTPLARAADDAESESASAEVVEEPPPYVSKAREVWRGAAQASEWEGVASKIDALPEPERSEPGTRYVRALAARQLGDCAHALTSLDGLAEALPLLEAEIDAMRSECQLSAGPFDSITSEHTNAVSSEGRLDAARALEQSGQHEQAKALLDGIVDESGDSPGNGRVKRDVSVQARSLRADLAERLGQLELAQGDRRWLALVAVEPDADVDYEKITRTKLSKAERAERAASLAERGLVSAVERELERLKKAPGAAPPRAELVRTLGWAHYRSRDDYARAAQLLEKAASLDGGNRASDLFKAASAWSRANQVKRALALYDQIVRRYPNSRAAEQAMHSKAHTFYSSGRWSEAARAYSQYLSRYERGKRAKKARFVRQSRYERAVAWLAQGNSSDARSAFEQLRKTRGSGYVASMLEHLEAVALATSGVARLEREAVDRFEQVMRRYPLSFAALLSAARLEQMGKKPPKLAPLPLVASEPEEWPELPAKARLLADLGLNSAAEVTLHEEEPALRQLYSSRASETLCRQYESLDRGFRRYSLAAGAVNDDILGRTPTASNLWAWQCLYPRPYAATIDRLEQRYALPPDLVYSVMRQESEFRPDARSYVGAVGLMQLMPGTAERAARELELDHASERLTQAEYNLELGAFYLGKLLGSFDQRVALAVASYNAGPQAVQRWLQGGKGLPLDIWAARIPYQETRNYLARVMSNWARYRYLRGGPSEVPELALGLPKKLTLPSDSY
ncbi:MAG TPA: transglycosylase SLT domain-containing protein, partial [Polyangiaceae bacterium]|nr:transglycosylase SLT domain-containing protein [Polyangiaceae bacterium]